MWFGEVDRRLLCLAACAFWCGWCEEARAHGAYHELLTRLNVEITARPTEALLYLRRAEIQIEHTEWRSALIDLELADRLTNDQVASEFLRARALVEGEQFAAAKTSLDAYIGTHPGESQPLIHRARVLSALSQGEEALEDYRRAFDLLKTLEPDHVFEFAALQKAVRGSEGALAILEEGIQRLGAMPVLVERAAEIEFELGRSDAALNRVFSAMESATLKTPWQTRYAILLARAGRIQESQKIWQVILDHIAGLPPQERGSHAMSMLSEQARQAQAALIALSQNPPPLISSQTP